MIVLGGVGRHGPRPDGSAQIHAFMQTWLASPAPSYPKMLPRHIVPGATISAVVTAILTVGNLILAEPALSFSGKVHLPPPPPGNYGGRGARLPWDRVVAYCFLGLASLPVVMSLNSVDGWERDRLDPHLRQVT